MFAVKDGVSKTQSPSEIVLNRKLNHNTHCKVEFGGYVQTHEEHNNDMTSRILGANTTRPSNDADPYYLTSLQIRRRVNQHSWSSLPMLEAVVSQFHSLMCRAKVAKRLTFTNSDNEDLDVLYVNLKCDKGDIELDHDDVQPVGVDDDDSNDDPQDDPDYDPNDDSGDDADDNDGDEGNAEHHDEETPGVDVEIPGVDDSDEDEETPGVDGETPGVDENANEDEAEAQETGSDEEVETQEAENNEDKDNTITRASGSMSLRKQS